MKNIVILCVALICGFSACSQNNQNSQNQFEYHFKILDSIARGTSSDVLLNCPESVKFMEKNTGIEATTDGNYFGRFSCKRNDLQKWHEWYKKNYRKGRI
ncbi:hypothetical protein V9K67_03925 [Paraflavisolibacter sp. H34]|uniref:hypothetical protein n=1 Tax=Huijunlia imazamoxiresistens TaxID=3127457 RepID=UPI00301B6AF8